MEMETPPQLDWKDSFREAFRNTQSLSEFLGTSLEESSYPLFVPWSLALKIKKGGPESPLWKQFVPSPLEENDEGLVDPIGDHIKSPVNRLIHRYENRVLLLPTKVCPIQCRYCFRKNELHGQDPLFDKQMEEAFDYLSQHQEVEEVILSGGDPLVLDNAQLKNLLERLSQIKHIRYLRFHTRVPVSLPERVNFSFLELIGNYRKHFHMTFVVHINHWDEWSLEASQVAYELKEYQLLSQSVLLKGVNDNQDSLGTLFRNLKEHGIRPYYLHHPDKARGTSHFWLDQEEGKQLYQALRQKLPGWMLPHYVIDSPDGSGKTSAFSDLDNHIH